MITSPKVKLSFKERDGLFLLSYEELVKQIERLATIACNKGYKRGFKAGMEAEQEDYAARSRGE